MANITKLITATTTAAAITATTATPKNVFVIEFPVSEPYLKSSRTFTLELFSERLLAVNYFRKKKLHCRYSIGL